MEKITLKVGFARALEDYKRIGDEEMVAFFEKRLEQANKKSTAERKPTAHQQENEEFKQKILNLFIDGELTLISTLYSRFVDNFGDGVITVNRLIALVTQLKNEGKVTRTEIKGKAYFTIA